MTTAGLAPSTVESYFRVLSAVMKAARRDKLIVTSAGLGLRQGEACGLTVDRVDFLRRQVRIDRQLVSPNTGDVRFGPTKTASSNRVLTLPAVVGDALAEHLARFDAGENGLIFTAANGAPLRRSTWQTAFARAAREIGTAASSHDLRHYCASSLIAAGCSVTAVQHFLGHKNASETLDTYSHLWPDNEDKIRAAIDSALRANVHKMCTGQVSST